MLGLVSLAVVVGVFPIIRRLLQRLETLQRSVQRFGEGDLSALLRRGADQWRGQGAQFNAAVRSLSSATGVLLAIGCTSEMKACLRPSIPSWPCSASRSDCDETTPRKRLRALST